MLIGIFLLWQMMSKSLNLSQEGEGKLGFRVICVFQGSVVRDVIKIVYYLFF
jgi:hypothetical protein